MVEAAGPVGRLDVLVSNASRPGPSPQPPLYGYPLGELRHVYETNLLRLLDERPPSGRHRATDLGVPAVTS